MKWKIGVKERLFLSFAGYSIVIFGFAFSIFILFKRVENFEKAYEASSKLHRATLEAIKSGHEFFLYELANEKFWRSRESALLDNQQKMILQIQLQSQKLLNSKWGESSPQLQMLIKELVDDVAAYDTTYKQMVFLTVQRGFKDYGIVGRFRKCAHELEVLPYTDVATLLQIRRNEKDYMLRSDWKYAEAVFELGYQYQKRIIADNKLSPSIKKTMNELISSYLAGFDSLLRIDSKLGHLKLLGLHGKIKRIGDEMTNTINEIETATNQEKNRVFRAVTLVTVSIVTLSVLLMLILIVSFQFIFSQKDLEEN